MTRSTRHGSSDWSAAARTALVAALAAMVITGAILYLPAGRWAAILGAGVIVFVVVLVWILSRVFWRRCLTLASLAIGAVIGLNLPKITLFATVFGSFGAGTLGASIEGRHPAVDIALVAFAAVCLIVAYLAWRGPTPRPRTSPSPTVTASNHAQAAGRDQLIAGGDAAGGNLIHLGPGATYTHTEGALDADTVKKIVDRYENDVCERDERIGALEQTLGQRERDLATLKAALARAANQARAGDKQAQAAIQEVRASGDVDQLQRVLIATADRREDEIKRRAADYFDLCREIAAIAFLRGDIDEAEKRLGLILRFVPDDRDAINRMGHVHMLRGRLEDAERSYRRVLELAGEDKGWQAVAYGNLGLIYQTRGDLDQAETMLRKALAIDQKLGRLEGMAAEYGNLGVIYMTRGDLDQAETMLRKALEIFEKLGHLQHAANTYGNLGSLYKQRGDLRAAREYWTKARDLYAKIGMPHMVKKLQGGLDGIGD